MIRRISSRMAGQDDEGLGVIFVIFISLMVVIMLGTASVALVAQIKPAAGSVNLGLATAAAEAGIDDAVGWLNTNCGSPDGLVCDTATPTVGQTVTKTLGANAHESFTWKVLAFVAGKMRVTPTGRALGPAVNGVQPTLKSTTLVADITATPSFTNFQYYTKYETFPADFINNFYGARNVQISNPSGSSLSGTGVLHWNGTCDTTTTPTCDPNHSTDICNDLYMPTVDGLGRSSDSAWNNSVRRPTSSVQSAMGTNTYFAYYSENGTWTPSTGSPSAVTHNDTCDSTFEPNMVMSGPIYSQDAYLVDRGKDTGSSKNSMPIFNDTAYSMWDGKTNGIQQAPGPNGGYARAYPNTDGQISTSLATQPVYTTDKLELPANANGAATFATCTYTGPTRILIKQGYAYITSPMTPTSPAPPGPTYCYASTGSFTNTNSLPGTGVANAQVPINSTLIYIQNPQNPANHNAATASSPIFSLATNLSVPSGFTPTDSTTPYSKWTGTYSSTSTCPATVDGSATRRGFDCEATATKNNAVAPDEFTLLKNLVTAESTDTTVSTANLATDLLAKIKTRFAGPVWVDTAPTSMNKGDLSYSATVTGPTSTGSTTTMPASQTDNFFQTKPGQGYSSSTNSWTITITRYACTRNGGCNSSQKSTDPVVTGTITRTGATANSPVNTASTWPWFGAQTGATTYTDPNNDITQYQSNWGDAYIQGQLTGEMTVVAEHDIVATNDLTYTTPNVNTTTDGLALVAVHNVRIYRPMTCALDGAAGQTTAGYCPNDLTGVYTTPLSWPLPANYPSKMYVPDVAPSMTGTVAGSGTGTIYATIFTLRGCFMVDNWYRGEIGVGATITGGLYQYHRGPTSLPYQGRPYQGSGTKMPGVTLTYSYDDMRLQQKLKNGLRVPWVPNPQNKASTSARTWNTVAISTGS